MTVLLEKSLDAYLDRDNSQESLIEHFQKASKSEKIKFLRWAEGEK